MIGYGIRDVRRARHRENSKTQLKQIGLALHAYHTRYSSFPPAYVEGPDGTRWHSWRVLLLPFLGQSDLYNQYRFDEPWNGPHNIALADRIPDAYASGTRQVTNYLAVVGRATA